VDETIGSSSALRPNSSSASASGGQIVTLTLPPYDKRHLAFKIQINLFMKNINNNDIYFI
jgi:hypothetical protein